MSIVGEMWEEEVDKLRTQLARSQRWAQLWHRIARTAYSQYGLLWNATKTEETIGQRVYYYFLYKAALDALAKERALHHANHPDCTSCTALRNPRQPR